MATIIEVAARDGAAELSRHGIGPDELVTLAIEPELFAKFPSSEAVNEALRSFLKQREQSAA